MKNKKILIFNLGVLLAVFFCVAVVIAGSGHYTLHTNVFSMYDVDPVVEVSYDREGVVELSDYYMQNNELILEFDAVGKGETNVRIRHQFYEGEGYIEDSQRTFSVGLFNVIVDKSNGDIKFNGYLPVKFHGTGDVFSAACVGALVRGKPLEKAIKDKTPVVVVESL